LTDSDHSPDLSPPPTGFVVGIPRLLLYTAGYCYGAATKEGGRDWTKSGLSLAQIALSASAIEAWVGEWFAIAKERGELPDALKDKDLLPRGRPHEIVKEIVKAKCGVTLGDAEWYRKMRCLFELRNHLLHYAPAPREPGELPDALNECVRTGTFVPEGDDNMDWTSRMLVPSVASTASAIADETIEALWDLLVAPGSGDAA
jgi:hypothetical protein